MLALADASLGNRLPCDQNFSTRRNVMRDEALWAGGKEFVEARLQDRAEPGFEVRPQTPPTPLLSRKARDGSRDCRLTMESRCERHSRLRQNPDIGQDAQFPNHVYQFDMAGHDLLRFPVNQLVKNALK